MKTTAKEFSYFLISMLSTFILKYIFFHLSCGKDADFWSNDNHRESHSTTFCKHDPNRSAHTTFKKLLTLKQTYTTIERTMNMCVGQSVVCAAKYLSILVCCFLLFWAIAYNCYAIDENRTEGKACVDKNFPKSAKLGCNQLELFDLSIKLYGFNLKSFLIARIMGIHREASYSKVVLQTTRV